MAQNKLSKGSTQRLKIIGPAPKGYGTEPGNGDPEWSFDLVLTPETKKEYLSTKGDAFYIKKDNKTGEEFIRFVRKAQRKDGTDANPISVIDHRGDEWNPKELIGNGSVLNVSYALNAVKSKGTQRLKPYVLAVQVWDHQKYKPKSDFPVKTDSEVSKEPTEW